MILALLGIVNGDIMNLYQDLSIGVVGLSMIEFSYRV